MSECEENVLGLLTSVKDLSCFILLHVLKCLFHFLFYCTSYNYFVHINSTYSNLFLGIYILLFFIFYCLCYLNMR